MVTMQGILQCRVCYSVEHGSSVGHSGSAEHAAVWGMVQCRAWCGARCSVGHDAVPCMVQCGAGCSAEHGGNEGHDGSMVHDGSAEHAAVQGMMAVQDMLQCGAWCIEEHGAVVHGAVWDIVQCCAWWQCGAG